MKRRVTGQGPRVMGHGLRAMGQGSRATGNGSGVIGRWSKYAAALVFVFGLAAVAASPIADAAKRGDRAAVKTLLQQGADANAAHGDGMTALHWAATHGD